MIQSKKTKIGYLIILFLIATTIITTGAASAANGQLTEEEIQFMNDAKDSLNMVMTLLWVAVAIVLGIMVMMVIICYVLMSTTKKYLQRIDHLIGVRQSQRYGNWEDHNSYQKY
jgi:uncharacterized BrkB/YihY/UPF0761 family membrane protein